MSKHKPIVLHPVDVVPGQLYLAHDTSCNKLMPCKIRCTEEPGYLRGHVYLDSYRSQGMQYVATGYATFIQGGRTLAFSVKRRFEKDMWTFGDGNHSRFLMPLTKDWLMIQKMNAQMEIDKLTDYLKSLENMPEPKE